MAVRTLNHINIRTSRLADTVAFYSSVLGMSCKPPPGAKDNSRGTWICDEDGCPVIHVGARDARYPGDRDEPASDVWGGGAIHHVALECADYMEMLARLQAANLAVTTNEAPHIRLRQLFVQDPNGVTLERNFREAAEA